MNGEAILDAMNYLDDDLIAATAKIRSRKRKSYLYVLAAAAACLCLFVATQNEKSYAPTESAKNDYFGIMDRFYGEEKPQAPAENAQGAPAGSTGAAASIFVATVCVTELHDDAFVGSITTDADGGEMCHEQMVIQCEAEVLSELQVGDILQIRYTAGESNILLDYSVLMKNE